MEKEMLIGGGVCGALLAGGAAWWLAFRHTKRKTSANTAKLATSLREAQTKGDIILGTIEDGVVLLDKQGVIQLFNEGAGTITGWDKEDAKGLDWKLVFNFIDKKGEPVVESETPFAKALKSAQTVRDSTATIVSKSNMSVAASFSVTPTLDNGEVTGLIAVFRDVSEERQEENQRAEFISTASHEMRTPVAAIEGYLSLALNEKVATIDARAKDYLQKAHASTKHLGELFQDLLTSAKAEDGRLTNHPEVVEMGAFMEQLTSDLQFSAQKKNLAMEFMIGNSSVIDASAPVQLSGDKVVRPLYYVQVDPDRVREVVTNLFDNACKYTDAGKISLGLTGNDSIVQIYVRDTGHGVPPEDIPHLFQKFYRVDNSATRTIGGTGLGLFICRKIIELYRGRIWVESTLGQGSTFYINLPRLTTAQADKLVKEQATAAVQNEGALPTQPVEPTTPVAIPMPAAQAAMPAPMTTSAPTTITAGASPTQATTSAPPAAPVPPSPAA
jgi:PAS domain S-box-containing protein